MDESELEQWGLSPRLTYIDLLSRYGKTDGDADQAALLLGRNLSRSSTFIGHSLDTTEAICEGQAITP